MKGIIKLLTGSMVAIALTAGAAAAVAMPMKNVPKTMEIQIVSANDSQSVQSAVYGADQKLQEKIDKIQQQAERKIEHMQAISRRLQEKNQTKMMSAFKKERLRARDLAERVFVRGRQMNFDVPPVIKEGRTLVPVRAVTEGLGAEVNWDPASGTITVTRDGRVIELILGSITVKVDGEVRELDVPAFTMNYRTMVPLRFISEIFSEQVDYDAETGEIDIGLEEAANADGSNETAADGEEQVVDDAGDENSGEQDVEADEEPANTEEQDDQIDEAADGSAGQAGEGDEAATE